MNEPRSTELHAQYSGPDAVAVAWADARAVLHEAGVYWLSTTRATGAPHVTPVAGAWIDDAFFFSTGPDEQKAHNLAHDARVAVTTGSNEFADGLDVVIEGSAARVRDESSLELVAEALNAKYHDFFAFAVEEDHFGDDGTGRSNVFVVAPRKAFAYARGAVYSATRYRFAS